MPSRGRRLFRHSDWPQLIARRTCATRCRPSSLDHWRHRACVAAEGSASSRTSHSAACASISDAYGECFKTQTRAISAALLKLTAHPGISATACRDNAALTVRGWIGTSPPARNALGVPAYAAQTRRWRLRASDWTSLSTRPRLRGPDWASPFDHPRIAIVRSSNNSGAAGSGARCVISSSPGPCSIKGIHERRNPIWTIDCCRAGWCWG
jgi:hypothetical protein